jgi:hypothetical protein
MLINEETMPGGLRRLGPIQNSTATSKAGSSLGNYFLAKVVLRCQMVIGSLESAKTYCDICSGLPTYRRY